MGLSGRRGQRPTWRSHRGRRPEGGLESIGFRSVGLQLKDESVLAGRPWDERLEMSLARAYGRPALCVLHPFIDAPILEVLEAFQTQAPDLDDREGRVVR